MKKEWREAKNNQEFIRAAQQNEIKEGNNPKDGLPKWWWGDKEKFVYTLLYAGWNLHKNFVK